MMKKPVVTIIFIILTVTLSAQGFDSRLSFSGIFDSTISYAIGSGDAPTNLFGIEEYANLRLRLAAGENIVFYSAFDLIAMAGSYTVHRGESPSSSAPPENFSAAIELERLYMSIYGNYVDTELGLFRIPIGYGQVWASSDFLNPRNPLLPNARPRGILGADFSFYPSDETKLMFFATSSKNPWEISGGGFIPGITFDQHWDTASLQLLYAYETPLKKTPQGLHRFGISFKTDLVVGITADGLYTLDADSPNGIDGLSIGAGVDYSFFGGDLYLLAEYLFNGNESSTSTSVNREMGRSNYHYLYTSALYRFNDFSSLSLSALFCFDDLSFQPIAAFNYELFQGFTLNLTVNVPLDRSVFSDGPEGELGPLPPGREAGAKLLITAGAKLRF